MAGPTDINREEEDDDLAAARWVLAIDEGLEPGGAEAFEAWLAARPERVELIARQAALPTMARQAMLQDRMDNLARQAAAQNLARRRANEQALKSRRRVLLGGAIAAGVVAVGGGFLAVRAPWVDSTAVYETATGEVRTIELADGSRLWLDTRTRVSTHMTAGRREVTLDAGRLFVDVAHDPDRPFLVHGAHFEARAIGTAFEATVFADRVGVAVTEGVVRFTSQDSRKRIDLPAGEGAWVTASGEVTHATAAVQSIGAWREHRMVLSDRRLDAALAELSRYFDRPLTVADRLLAARRVSLSFSIADMNEEEAARIIADAVDAEVAGEARDGILLRPMVRGSDATPGSSSSAPR